MILVPKDWRAQGACVGKDPNLWFPDTELLGTSARANYKLARAICATCPVIQECEDHAMNLPEPWGMWAGMNPRERGIKRSPTLALPDQICHGCGATFTPRTNRARYCPPGPDGRRCKPRNVNQLSLA